jgi:hypothetical protein
MLQTVWWILLVLLVLTNGFCTYKGIQPNPIYRVVNRRLLSGGTRVPSKTVMGGLSVGCLLLGVMTGMLVYYACLKSLSR